MSAPFDLLPFRLGRWVGRSLPRLEDARLLTGSATYLADLRIPGALHTAFVRSPHPQALIRGITPPPPPEFPASQRS